MPQYYPSEKPSQDDIVVARVTSFTDVAVYCTLPAYSDIEAMIPTSEINIKRHKAVRDYVRVGQLLTAQVIRMDKNIDLSLKQVREEESAATLVDYHKAMKVDLVVRSACAQNTDDIATMYRDIIWKLDDAYAVFEQVKAGSASCLPANVVAAIMQKMPNATYTAEKDVTIRFGSFADGVQRLNAELGRLASLDGVQVIVAAPPTYRLVARDKTQAMADARLTAALSTVLPVS